ncbi:unnamed protein product [Prorocentrum cordatum]|uniref:WW domain-containing protein n=1 Tax=Prorocentrum cordatum TaxID=2364126 RepID=A0ABN9TEP6_9DINO|nr:unnamed protein product [Polarella glacialis]
MVCFGLGAAVLSVGVEAARTPWTEAERRAYLEPLEIVLDAALAAAPLVRPWALDRDAKGRVYFVHVPSGRSSRRHPLEQQRQRSAREVGASWEGEAASGLKRWCTAADGEGREYYYNVETETTWENPATALLASLYVKTRALEALCRLGGHGAPAGGEDPGQAGATRAQARSATEVVQQLGQQHDMQQHIQEQRRQEQQARHMQEQHVHPQMQHVQEQRMQQQPQWHQQQAQPQPWQVVQLQQQPQPQQQQHVELTIQQPQQPQSYKPAWMGQQSGPLVHVSVQQPFLSQMPAGMGTQTGPLVHVTVQQPLFDNQLVQQLLQMTGQVSQNAPWMLQSQMAQLGAPPPTSVPPPWCTITNWGRQDTLDIESLVGSAP